MKRFKEILYTMIAFSSLLIWGCSEEPVAVDYTDDSAYPPPVVTLASGS